VTLPVERVVLFKHGVGYFERHGRVQGDQSIDLHFKAAEMNDVLKSLTVLDMTGGHVASISYESTLPTEKRLEDVALRLPDDAALSGLLRQVKGARVRIEIGGEPIEGTVAGLESVTRRFDQETLTTERLVLLVDSGTLRAFDLLEIQRVTLLDDGLKQDLAHLLEILIGAKKKDLKRLTIFARGQGERELMASYVVETPVWKTSYRVILGGEQPRIQGWALVDNTQDEDWNDVALSLVAGLPVSFVHDLYSPRHRRRPVVQVQEEEAYAPPMLEEGFSGYAGDEEAPSVPMPRAAAAPAPARMMAPPPPAAPGRASPQAMREARERTAAVQTRTVQVGDLFQYVIDKPVTVKRGQSALVPILSSTFSGKRVAVYNEEIREKNPMSAIWFENSTGLTLEGGPLTVLEDESYVGESMLETMKPGDKRLVPYSVELGCLVTKDHASESKEIYHARIVNGVLWLTRYHLDRVVYEIRNKLETPLDLFLEHRIADQTELVDTPEPFEKTERFYRFRTEVPPRQTAKFTVTQRGNRYESFQLASVSRDQIGAWVSSRYLDEATERALGQIVGLNETIARFGRDVAERERQIKQIHENQARKRENLGALGNTHNEQKLRERYVSELAQEEDTLQKLLQLIDQGRSEKEQLENQLRAALASLNLNRHV